MVGALSQWDVAAKWSKKKIGVKTELEKCELEFEAEVENSQQTQSVGDPNLWHAPEIH